MIGEDHPMARRGRGRKGRWLGEWRRVSEFLGTEKERPQNGGTQCLKHARASIRQIDNAGQNVAWLWQPSSTARRMTTDIAVACVTLRLARL